MPTIELKHMGALVGLLLFADQAGAVVRTVTCDSLFVPGVPNWRLLEKEERVDDLIASTFQEYANNISVSYVQQCTTKFSALTILDVPSDPTGQTPNPAYNAYVSTQVVGVSRPVQPGDVVATVVDFAGGWGNASLPDVYDSIAGDLTAGDPGMVAGLPDASVTCRNNTRNVTVAGMACAVCEIERTCLLGMGCFRYFGAMCFYDTDPENAANLMVRDLTGHLPFGVEQPPMMACDNFPVPQVPEFSLLEAGQSVDAFVAGAFQQYNASLNTVYSQQCLTKFAALTIQEIPFDPTGQTANPGYNAFVSTQMIGLSRPAKVGDVIGVVHPLAGGWGNRTAPNVFASISDDLTENSPGQVPGVPDGSVTCRNSTRLVNVSGMTCAVCDIERTCLLGMGCFGYFAVECHYSLGSAVNAASLMVRTLAGHIGHSAASTSAAMQDEDGSVTSFALSTRFFGLSTLPLVGSLFVALFLL